MLGSTEAGSEMSRETKRHRAVHSTIERTETKVKFDANAVVLEESVNIRS
jgi:hypothetical protein